MENDLNIENLAFVEELFSAYLEDPNSVPTEWQNYFSQVQSNGSSQVQLGPSFRPPSIFHSRAGLTSPTGQAKDIVTLQDRVDQLIRNYRVRGHLIAKLNPLGGPQPPAPELDPAYYGFTEEHLDLKFSTDTIEGAEQLTLRQILQRLQNTYCRSIGVQYMHIDDPKVRAWLRVRMEGTENRIHLSHEQQRRILTRLTDAVMLEEFIQKKYLGAKSFSLEGSESLIPLLELVIEQAGDQGVKEVILGMAHRGRLNVLVNIMDKSAQEVFREFEDDATENQEVMGDVKYHLGYSTDWKTRAGKQVHLSLCFNPSHLEFVNPVALGRARAKSDRHKDFDRRTGMVVLIHGDAAFAGEGVVQESLNLSQLEGYRTGGAFHVVVNNQIGFTTSPSAARSSYYATDVAKMLQIPIFHVNGEDPEAVAQAVRLCMDFRREFQRDVVIDMYCYRRRGHNEGDEPAFTQPLLYEEIRRRKSVREGYLEHLFKLGSITREEADSIAEARREELEKELSLARKEKLRKPTNSLQGYWQGYQGAAEEFIAQVATSVDEKQLAALLNKITQVPENFNLHNKLQRLFEARREMAQGKKPLDWATAEAAAFASLAVQGVRIRMSGQDVERGTFSQRHSVLHDVKTGERYAVLQNLSKDQAPVEIYNSPLCETGVLGFEYGYSLDCPDGLVIWEAQFGDFINAAQVIIDQFLASAEVKWRRLSGLVLLLPHALEGMGPEHSSARLERFLQICAQDNMQVVYPSTPAQYFHCLRRQALRAWRKPLIVMTPKSLLRNPMATSELAELTTGSFQKILPDTSVLASQKFRKVILCSGKLYFELSKAREDRQAQDVAILRMEQFYPLSDSEIETALAPYARSVPMVWVQEEPENMGACWYLKTRFGHTLLGKHALSFIARPMSASPATGSASAHKYQQADLLERAFQ